MKYHSPVYVNASLVVFLISVCTFCVVAGTASPSIAGTNRKQQKVLQSLYDGNMYFID